MRLCLRLNAAVCVVAVSWHRRIACVGVGGVKTLNGIKRTLGSTGRLKAHTAVRRLIVLQSKKLSFHALGTVTLC